MDEMEGPNAQGRGAVPGVLRVNRAGSSMEGSTPSPTKELTTVTEGLIVSAMRSGRFAMALHALVLLGQSENGLPSECIAGSVNTHAAFLRRTLAELARAGLIEASEGRHGGYRLARPANRISLAEVYQAMETAGPLAPCPADPNPRCPVGRGMRLAFEEVIKGAQTGLLAALERRTVADVSERALRLGKGK